MNAAAGKDAMLSLEVRKRSGGAEVYRLDGGAVTVGASSGNEVVVRARGVAGRHVRISERGDGYHLDLYKGAEAVSVNGNEFQGGVISAGDRIRIGEATITVLGGGARLTPRGLPEQDLLAPRPVTVPVLPATEVEYRALRLAAYRVCRESGSVEELATELTEFLDRELPPSEWAVGELSAATGFRPVASTFRESPALPPRLLEEARSGAGVARFESVTGLLTLVPEPDCGTDCLAILVRESPRLAARAVLFLEELAAVAGIAVRARLETRPEPDVLSPSPEAAPPAASQDVSEAASVLRQTDDLKKIVETVEREVIDRAMRRAQGNQSRGSQILNISRGSLIAKLKDYGIPDYRYLRRQRGKRA
jgi:pSer/pThr/pTyr-binding forkhead associated (FHA) protein